MQRDAHLARLRQHREPWDMLIIGGGATGLGTALDAASRGYAVALLEQRDFASGTSSRSTKLIHGGLRYLRQGRVSLVRQALRERTVLRQNAPHLVEPLPFVVPCRGWSDRLMFSAGIKAYDLLASGSGFPSSRWLSQEALRDVIPGLRGDALAGGIVYHDAQFDDARLAMSLALTAADHGAALVNYVRATGFSKNARGAITGVTAVDEESGAELEIPARIVVNAAGPFVDHVRGLDDATSPPMLSLSQGAHLVLDRSLIGGDTALIVPRTSDGRVLFAIPWQDVLVVGTTDTPIREAEIEPTPQPQEISFMLETLSKYLSATVSRGDVLSVFAGIRPLVSHRRQQDTAAVSREHHVRVDPTSGLLTVAGGKWTTYRWMAEQVVDEVATRTGLPKRRCMTAELPLRDDRRKGIEQLALQEPSLAEKVHPDLPLTGAQVAWSCRMEMARTVEDVLARRSRCLLLNARASSLAAPTVAARIAAELQRDTQWSEGAADAFQQLAQRYTCNR